MRHRVEEVIQQGELTASGVSDFKRALIKISGPWPEAVGAGTVASPFDAVTPHTLSKIDRLTRCEIFLARFARDLCRRRSRGVLSLSRR
jgi:hypothetical protein